MTIYDNVLYYTKRSGSNGVNTVYFVDTTGKACPNGVGLPVKGAALPTAPLSYNPATLLTEGLPSNICILAGFPAVPNRNATTTAHPFGLYPNKLVVITDLLKNTDPGIAAKEQFFTVRAAGFAEVLRGVSFTPGTPNR